MTGIWIVSDSGKVLKPIVHTIS